MNKRSWFYRDIFSSTEPELESYSSAYMKKVKQGEEKAVQSGSQVDLNFSSMRVGLKCQGQLSCDAPVWQVMDALEEQELGQVWKSSSSRICPHPCVPACKVACVVTLAVAPGVLCHDSLQSFPGSCCGEDNFSSSHRVIWIGEYSAAIRWLRKRFTSETAASGGEQEPYIQYEA